VYDRILAYETRVIHGADTCDPDPPWDADDFDDYSVNSHDVGSAAASAAAAEELRL
jgi:hypothetical protein